MSRAIDPDDPFYRGLTKATLRSLNLPRELKAELTMALFGTGLDAASASWEEQVKRRWAGLLGNAVLGGRPYRVQHEDLIERVRRKNRRPTNQERTVSAFAEWVMSQYAPTRNMESMWAGQLGERAVVDRRAFNRRVKRDVPRNESGGWRLVFDGIRGAVTEPFTIPSLTVNGAPLLGLPDLVFKERKTDRILIVELKVSPAILPSDGWPNLRAQLWAYSRIAKWAKAPEVLLAGEVWSGEHSEPCLRRTYFWRARDPILQSQCGARPAISTVQKASPASRGGARGSWVDAATSGGTREAISVVRIEIRKWRTPT